MLKMKRYLCLFFLFVTVAYAGEVQLTPQPILSDDSGNSFLIQGNSRFAFELFKQLGHKQNNIVFSPYSISMAFDMVASGAAGKTAAEMQEVLHYSVVLGLFIKELQEELTRRGEQTKNSSELSIANSVWVQNDFGLLPTFQQTIQRTFSSPIESVDFENQPIEALNKINTWVSNITKKRINQIMTPQDVTKETRLVLASAIYLKAPWAKPFEVANTAQKPFKLIEGGTRNVAMMKTAGLYSLYVNDHFALVSIPYAPTSGGTMLSMMILLPNDSSKWSEFVNTLSYDQWNHWTDQAKMRQVNLSLPHFRMEDRYDLNSTMEALGLKTAFTPQADFSGINGQKNLFINKAIHKTFIKVDEKGTEAAAATAISMNLTSVRTTEEPYDFVADHPFIFFIVDRNKTILFMGQVTKT